MINVMDCSSDDIYLYLFTRIILVRDFVLIK